MTQRIGEDHLVLEARRALRSLSSSLDIAKSLSRRTSHPGMFRGGAFNAAGLDFQHVERAVEALIADRERLLGSGQRYMPLTDERDKTLLASMRGARVGGKLRLPSGQALPEPPAGKVWLIDGTGVFAVPADKANDPEK